MHRLFIVLAFAAALGRPAFATPSREAMTLAFHGSIVTASGVTPRTTVVFLGVATLRVNYANALTRFTKTLADDDGDGVVSYDIGRSIPANSDWIAVDSASGEFFIASPRHAAPAPRAQQQQALRKGGDGLVDRFTCDCLSVDMLYIEPRHGVWLVHAVAATPSDHDPREAVTAASLADALQLLPTGEAVPRQFSSGGIVVAFDQNSRSAVTMRITASDLGGDR